MEIDQFSDIIARRCLNKYWKLKWDEGSPAYWYAYQWVKRNTHLRKMTFVQIYKEYLVILRQE